MNPGVHKPQHAYPTSNLNRVNLFGKLTPPARWGPLILGWAGLVVSRGRFGYRGGLVYIKRWVSLCIRVGKFVYTGG